MGVRERVGLSAIESAALRVYRADSGHTTSTCWAVMLPSLARRPSTPCHDCGCVQFALHLGPTCDRQCQHRSGHVHHHDPRLSRLEPHDGAVAEVRLVFVLTDRRSANPRRPAGGGVAAARARALGLVERAPAADWARAQALAPN